LRNGYSRHGLTSEYHRVRAKLEDDKTAVSDFASFTANQVCDCLSFFEKLYATGWPKASMSNHQQALVVLFSLDDRFNAIVKEFEEFDMSIDEFCDGGFSNLNVDDVKTRFKTQITIICSHFPGKKLKEVILSMKLLRDAASKRLQYDVKDSKLNWRTLGCDLIHLSI
jgi:hypothetical protein